MSNVIQSVIELFKVLIEVLKAWKKRWERNQVAKLEGIYLEKISRKKRDTFLLLILVTIIWLV